MITVITKPISRVYDGLKWGQNIIKKIQGKPIKDDKYGGHFAVTRSIVEGLQKIGADFNYNPKSIKEIGEIVYVPGGRQALKWAIKMKKRGVIKKLVAGPNHVVIPSEKGSLIRSKQIDLFLANSAWVRDFYIEDSPDLADHIDFWPAGVDTEFWKPNKKSGIAKNILFYSKRPIKKMFDECKKILEDNGYKVEIIYYGKYSINDYRDALNRNSFLVHFVEQESQGISLSEAWSMDTPTFVWNPEYYRFDDGTNHQSSSSPYLTKVTGKFFRDSTDFKNLLTDAFDLKKYTPRQWVLENISDDVCAKKLLLLLK